MKLLKIIWIILKYILYYLRDIINKDLIYQDNNSL